MGYLWNPIFRLTPGGDYTLKTSMPYAGGATKIDLNYIPVMDSRETANKTLSVVHYGFRIRVGFTFAIGGNMADHNTLVTIVNALVDPTKTVQLSLNGGTTFRYVDIRRYEGPDPFDGKTFAGAYYSLEVETTSLVQPPLPAIGSGTW